MAFRRETNRRASWSCGSGTSEASSTLAALLPRLEQKRDDAHLEQSRRHDKEARQSLDELGDVSGELQLHLSPIQVAAQPFNESAPGWLIDAS